MKVVNTLSGEKEEFLPEGSQVRMYVCGVTPYDESHIGHAMSYIYFDVIRRYLAFRGYRVKYVQNLTDIDDKIIDRANQRGIPAKELAEGFISRFFEDMKALNITPADVYPRATEEIPKIIEVIQGLVAKGHAYPVGGSVYFRVQSFPDYGKLSHRSLEAVMSAETDLGKEHPMDFALWKAAKPGEPYWESPWGQGRPGWHIECSAMSLKYLGDTLDIHGGGQDLVFPHHENEIAQSECFTGVKPFVKYWLHNGMLQLGGEKMSKSLGNLVTIKEALTKYGADALRIFVLGSHYRSPLTYSIEALEGAKRGAERIRQAAESESKGDKPGDIDVAAYRSRFIEAMDDDFNTSQALATFFDLTRDINRASDSGCNVAAAQKMLRELSGVMGLILKPLNRDSIEISRKILTCLLERPRISPKAVSQILDEMDYRIRAGAEAARKAEEAAELAVMAVGNSIKALEEANNEASELAEYAIEATSKTADRVEGGAKGEVTNKPTAFAVNEINKALRIAQEEADKSTSKAMQLAEEAVLIAGELDKRLEEASTKAIPYTQISQVLDEMNLSMKTAATLSRISGEIARTTRNIVDLVTPILEAIVKVVADKAQLMTDNLEETAQVDYSVSEITAIKESTLRAIEVEKRLMQAGESAYHTAKVASRASSESLAGLWVISRNQFRVGKQFELADKIRSQLSELGITLEDTPQGTLWKYKR